MTSQKIPYYVWIVLSALFYAAVEYLSKKFATNSKDLYLVTLLMADVASLSLWLLALHAKNQLGIVGPMWAVLGLLVTEAIAFFVFGEKVTAIGAMGITFALAALVCMSWK